MLAENLGLTIVAEGVETAAQREFLLNNGCQSYQGYFFSHPLPLEEFYDYFARVQASPGSEEFALVVQ